MLIYIALDGRKTMTLLDLLKLSEKERTHQFQKIDPYNAQSKALFQEIKLSFLSTYPKCAALSDVSVGAGPGLGPINAICVRVPMGVKIRIPRKFLGLQVFRLDETQRGWKTRY